MQTYLGMRTVFVLTTVVAASCAGTTEPVAGHPRGYAARMEDADVHSQHAEEHRETAGVGVLETPASPFDRYSCGDTVMSDQLTSGGQRIVDSVPCWDISEERVEHARYLAEREQRRADAERRAATRLVEVEDTACRGMSPRELEHSPFAHRKEIAAVIPHRDAGKLRGVRILWKPVPGLTSAWMRQSIACHRARFERLGEPAIYFPEDPTLVAGAIVTVEQHAGHLEVVIETGDDLAGQVALDRAQDLVRPRTAGR
jgi:hypothetical protein